MSARVCSSLVDQLLMPRNSGYDQPLRKVRKVLFGPPDPDATQRFIDEELRNIVVTKSEIWNIDFETGRNLHPDGAFDWRPATPKKKIRVIKRTEDSETDNSSQYCNLPELKLFQPKARCPPYAKLVPKTQQRRITDFMKAAKRPAPSSESTKKQATNEWDQNGPSNKIPRLDIPS